MHFSDPTAHVANLCTLDESYFAFPVHFIRGLFWPGSGAVDHSVHANKSRGDRCKIRQITLRRNSR